MFDLTRCKKHNFTNTRVPVQRIVSNQLRTGLCDWINEIARNTFSLRLISILALCRQIRPFFRYSRTNENSINVLSVRTCSVQPYGRIPQTQFVDSLSRKTEEKKTFFYAHTTIQIVQYDTKFMEHSHSTCRFSDNDIFIWVRISSLKSVQKKKKNV